MSDYMFGVGYGLLSARKATKIDRIAKKHGARFINADLPDGPRHWFACQNLGNPFDAQRAREVMEALKAAGLYECL